MATNAITDGGSTKYPYANYQEKYDMLPSGIDNNMIAFLELYGMSDYVDDRLWQIYDSKMVMRYRADAPELKKYTDPTLASTYTGIARDISDIYLDGYNSSTHYRKAAKLYRLGHSGLAYRAIDDGTINEIDLNEIEDRRLPGSVCGIKCEVVSDDE